VTVSSSTSSNSPSSSWLRALELTAPIPRHPQHILPLAVEEWAQRFGAAPALLSEQEVLTYRALAARANQYARWAVQQDLVDGAVLALLMPNCPDYFAIWLGVTRVGGVVALINTSLTGSALAHSLDIVGASHAIVASGHLDALLPVLDRLRTQPRVWCHGAGDSDLANALAAVDITPPPAASYEAPTINHRALYIYTSGTSGLPKAVNVSHFRLMQWTHWFAGLMHTQSGDRLYNCLPMYHSIGGVVAVGAPLVNGGAVVIRQGFSASQFWSDVVKWDCTLFQYIGELCRYLLAAPGREAEHHHRLRLCCGNGLRADTWVRFKERFAIPHILEYYASTEGNFSLFNVEEKIGAIGRIPSLLRHRHAIALIRCNEETTAPLRDSQGLCVRCAVDEVGEAIGELRTEASNASTQFEGYTDPAASSAKLLRDVFTIGDRWYRTGDLMRRDAAGYFYFVDRLGDTFRWKGENVATSQIADCIRGFEGTTDAVVYGVKVPGTEGRAGMVALETTAPIDLGALRRHLITHLPVYARPLFVRLLRHIPMTATHKPRKLDLVREGFDPTATEDPIYFDDPIANAYVLVDAEFCRRVESGHVRF
jgi:fatty-acyl-CoA synthase